MDTTIGTPASIAMPHRLRHLARQLVACLALAGVQAELHPVELGQHVVGEVELAVAPDVDLRPSEDPKRSHLLVHGGNLLGLASQSVGVEPRHDADVRCVVADREVLVAEVARGQRHLEDRCFPVRPGRVHVEIAADVTALEQRGRFAAEGLLSELRWAPRHSQGGVHRFLLGRRRQLAQRLDVRPVAGSTEQLRAEPRRLGDDELDRDTFDGHPEGASRGTFEQGDDRRQRGERLEHRFRIVGRANDGEVERRVRPPPRVSGNFAAERVGDLLQQRARTIEQHPLSLLPAFALQPLEQAPLCLLTDTGNRGQPPSVRRLAKFVRGRDAERAPDLHHPLRTHSQEAAEPDQLGLNLALELVELGDATCLDELLQAAGDAGADPPQLLHAAGGDELRDRRLGLANRLRGPAICARRVVARSGKVEQARECLELLCDERVLQPFHRR